MPSDIQSTLTLLEKNPQNADALAALRAQLAESAAGAAATPAAAETERQARLLEQAYRLHVDRSHYELALQLIDLGLPLLPLPAARIERLLEKAQILYDRLLREEEAVGCLDQALAIDSGHLGAQERLSHILLVRDNWKRIARKYLDEARTATDRGLATSLHCSAGELYLRYQPDDVEAEKHLRKSLEIDPRNRRALEYLTWLLSAQNRYDDLAALYTERVQHAANREERAQAYLAAAGFLHTRPDKRQLALEYYEKVLGVDPGNERALSCLVDAHTADENWAALIRAYENALRSRPRGDSELGMYLQIGMLEWRKLGDLDAAEEYFRRVRKIEPSNPAMLDFYRDYHGQRGEPQKLLLVLSQAQKLEADASRKLALGVEIARLAEGEPTAIEKAIDAWKGVQRQEPKHPEAGSALRRLYRKAEKWNALLEALKDDIERLPADRIDDKIARYLEIVEIYRDRMGIPVMVINTYMAILALCPTHPGALDALAAKYEEAGRWNDLINVLARKAESCADKQTRIALLRRVAALWVDKFGNHGQAVKPLEEILALDAADTEASTRLKDIYQRRRAWRSLLELLRRELAALPRDAQQAQVVEMAKLAAERLGDMKEAITLWNQALAMAPEQRDGQALAALASLYERDRRWAAMVEVLGRQLSMLPAGDIRAQVALLERIGSYYSERLAAPRQAAQAYRAILEREPTHAKALRVLRDLYAVAGDFAALEELFGGMGAWEELVETLNAVAERSPDAKLKLQLYGRVAELCRERLRQPERAVKAYERILAVEPTNRTAAQALVPIYRQGEKWPRLLSTYEILLGHAEGKSEQLALFQEIRKLCEERLGSRSLAFQWCARAYAVAPEDGQLRAELARLAAEADAWEELAELYHRRVTRIDSQGEAATEWLLLTRELARVAHTRLGRADEARAHYARLLEAVPEDGEALTALEQIFTQGQMWADLLGIYRRRLLSESEPPRRLDLLFKTAFIEEERLSDLGAATVSYRAVLAEDGGNLRALRALERIHEERGEWPDLCQVLGQQLDVAGDNETRVTLHHRMGELFLGRLRDPRRSLDQHRMALALAPMHRPTVTALEQFLTPRSAERVEVARLLVPYYEQVDESARLAAALEVLFEAEPDTEVEARRALLGRLVFLHSRRLSDIRAAYGAAVRLFVLAPGDGECRAQLAVFAEKLGAFEDLAGRYMAVVDQVLEAELAAALARELAQMLEERLGRPAEAEGYWKRVLALDPASGEAFDALSRLYQQAEKWGELRALLAAGEQRAEDPEVRRELLFRICELEEQILGDEAAAVRSYEAVLELDPSCSRAYKALERLHAAAGRFAELDAVLERELGQVEDTAAAVALAFRRAELRVSKLDDPAGAVEMLEGVLQAEAGHEPARRLLERLMGRKDLRLRVARILAPLYEQAGDYSFLVSALSAQREFAERPEEAVDLLARVAEVEETKLSSRQQAFLTWREAFLLRPEDGRASAALLRLAAEIGRFGELAESLEQGVARLSATDVARRAEMLTALAELYQRELCDGLRATSAWERLLALDPTRLATAQPAAAALTRLYEQAAAWPALCGVLRQQAEWAESLDQRKQHLFRAAEVEEGGLRDAAAAVTIYGEILELDPEETRALDALERIHHAASAWAELCEVLRRRVDLAKQAAARRDLWWRIAEIQEVELGRPAEAVRAFHAILDEQPSDISALDALARLHEAAGRFPDLEEVLERRLALASEAATRQALLSRLAVLLEEQLGRRDQALERFREILEIDPTDPAARAGLERMLGDEVLRLRAAEVLEPIYEAQAEYEKLVGIEELFAAHAPDVRERLLRRRRAAELREQRLADLAGAFALYAQAARDALGEPELAAVLDALDRLALAAGRHAELAALLAELAPEVLDGRLQLRIFLTIAETARLRTLDQSQARDYYQRVVEAEPGHLPALAALEELLLAAEEWAPLLDIYRQRVELAVDDEQVRRQYLARVAGLCEQRLGMVSEAIAAHEQILELAPADIEAARALERLYAGEKRYAELADLIERRLGFAEDLEEAVSLRFRLGEIFERELFDSDRAVDNYRAVLGGDLSHQGAIEALERYLDEPTQKVVAAEVLEPVYAARQQWTKLVQVYEIRLQAAEESKQRLLLCRRIARLYEEQLEDLDAAFRWFARVFQEDPSDRAIRDQLFRLAGILGRWPDLAQVFEEYLQGAFEEGLVTMEVARLLASICDERLNDVDRARTYYRRVLAQDPEDAQTLALLDQCLSRNRRWHDLLEVYADAVEAAPQLARKKSFLFRMSLIEEEQLSEPADAIRTYRQVVELDPEDGRAQIALARLFEQLGRHHDHAELLHWQVERAHTPAEQVEKRFKLGALYEHRLHDLSAAVDAYQEVLRQDSRHKGALDALERVVLVDEQRLRIAQILEPLYRSADEWGKLVVILDAELEFIDDRPRRVAILREIARLQETRGGNLDLSFKALARAWQEDVGDEQLLTDLERLAGRLGFWPALVETLERGADGIFDYQQVARIHARVARLVEQRLGDLGRAVGAWRRVLQACEDDAQALAEVERLLSSLGRHEELCEVLEHKATLAGSPLERKDIHYRIAGLWERELGRAERAIETWRRVLGEDDEDMVAVEALERLYAERGEWRELVWVYQRRGELCEDAAGKRTVLLLLARLHEHRLEEPFEAISCYRAILDAQADDQEALEALDRLYAAEGRFADLADVLAARISHQPEVERREEMRFRLGRVFESELHDVEAAIGCYRGVLEALPRHAGARSQLDLLLRTDSWREAAAQVLEPVYRSGGEWDLLADLYEQRIPAESDSGQRWLLLRSLAEIQEHGRRNLGAAFATWARALAEMPGDEETHRELERLAADLGGFAELVKHYQDRLEATFDAELGRLLALKIAGLAEQQLGDSATAVSYYRRALDQPGDPSGPLAALDRLLSAGHEHRDLCEVLEREAEASQEVAAQAEFLFRRGQVLERELGEVDEAIGVYREALLRQPAHKGARKALSDLLPERRYRAAALDILEPLLDPVADAAELAELGELRLEITEDEGGRVQLLERLAEIYERRLQDPEKGLDTWARAVATDPGSSRFADELIRLAGELSSWDEAALRLERVLEAGVPEDAARDLGLRAARIHLEKLGDNAAAEQRLRAVLAIDPENGEALGLLEGIYRALGRQLGREPGQVAPLCEVLRRRAELEPDLGRKKTILGEVAGLEEEQLRDLSAAVSTWKAVTDLDESDATALAALARLYQGDGDFGALVEVLEQTARFADGPVAEAAARRRIGELCALRLGDLDRAAAAYREVLDLLPDDQAALCALEEVHAERQDWEAVKQVLIRQLAAASEAATRVEIYRKLAHLSEDKLGNAEEAIAYYHQILDSATDDQQGAAALPRLLEAAGKWYDLIDVLRRQAESAAASGDQRGELERLVKVATIWEEKLESPDAAAEVLEKILEREPHNVSALTALARTYAAGRDFERSKQMLLRAVEESPHGHQAAELCFRLGRVEAELAGDEAAGQAQFVAALENEPGHAAALAALLSIARAKDDTIELVRLLDLRVQHEEAAARLPILLELGQLSASKLHDLPRSLGYLERAHALGPDQPQVMEPLADLYFGLGREAEAEPLYRALLERLGKARRGKELARLYFRVGAIAERRGDRGEAMARYQAAQQMDATHAPTLEALGRLATEDGDYEKARRVYRSMLLQNLDASAGITKADVYLRLGQIHEKLGEAAKARGMYERGLELEQQHAELRAALAALRV